MLVSLDARATLLQFLPKGGIGAEIGVFAGDFSVEILRVAQARTLHLVDPWIATAAETHAGALYSQSRRSQTDMDALCERVKARFATQIANRRVILHRERSETAMAGLADESLDFVYIDGDHTEAAVALDLELALRKVKPQGLICGDDYTALGWWRDGVIRATNRFVGAHCDRVRFEFLCDGQYVLRKSEPMA